jgi:hypothetical protein
VTFPLDHQHSPSGCPGRVTGDWTRRGFLRNSSAGFGWLALAGLLGDRSFAGAAATRGIHFPARAKNVIFCFMDGGPSHVDTFDPKPSLATRQGEAIGDSAVSKLSQSSAGRVWLGSPWTFHQRGQSGLWVSDLFPHIARVADELCVVRSMIGQLPPAWAAEFASAYRQDHWSGAKRRGVGVVWFGNGE